MGWSSGFESGSRAARNVIEAYYKAKEMQEAEALKGDLSAVNKDYTPTETQVASGEDALAGAQKAKEIALASAADDTQRQQIEQDYADTFKALESDKSRPASVVHSIGIGRQFRQQEQPFSDNEVETTKGIEQARVYSKYGQPENASRVILNAKSIQAMQDDADIRAAMTPQSRQRQQIEQGPTDMADVTASHTPPTSAQPVNPRIGQVQGGVTETINADLNHQASTAYYERKAPQIIDTYLAQGKVDEAKKFRDFVSSESGQKYTEQWSRGVRKFAIGDHRGALSDWQTLYNSQLYDDGKTVKLVPSQDGKNVDVQQFGPDGKLLGAKTLPIDTLAKQAGMALAPEALVKFRAEQDAKRESESATLDRQTQLEQMRQEGQDARDDRRDARLVKTLDARQANGGLTLPQQRSNESIVAARRQLSGMKQPDVLAKTQASTTTGRANPNYDPQLAKIVTLANTRMYGDDPAHDAFTAGPRQPAQQPAAKQPAGATTFDRADVSKRFRSDKAMINYTIGKETPNGVEVLSKGKLVGYYR